MGSRGRQSSDDANIVSLASAIARVERPAPPPELSADLVDEWVRIVEVMPADWFGVQSHGVLMQYCRHRIAAKRIAHLIKVCESAEDFDLDEYDRLLKMQEREGRAISSLATRMRLTQQASYDKKKKIQTSGKRPWDL